MPTPAKVGCAVKLDAEPKKEVIVPEVIKEPVKEEMKMIKESSLWRWYNQ